MVEVLVKVPAEATTVMRPVSAGVVVVVVVVDVSEELPPPQLERPRTRSRAKAAEKARTFFRFLARPVEEASSRDARR